MKRILLISISFFLFSLFSFSCSLEPVERNRDTGTALSEKSEDTETVPITLWTLDASSAKTEETTESISETTELSIISEVDAAGAPEPEPELTWAPLIPEEDNSQDGKGTREGPEDPYWIQNTYEYETTVNYVLNTNTKRIHKPDCKDVPKIKPENYSTTNNPGEYLANGYKNCGHCGGCS